VAQAAVAQKEIHFFAPGLKHYETAEFCPAEPQAFVPISVTGAECALQCDHCQGRLLESMRTVRANGELYELCRSLASSGTKGVLISGGADALGRVPLLRYAGEIGRIKALGLRVLVHTGLVDEALAQALAEAKIDGAMLDIIGAEDTIRQVYHLQASLADYEASLANLARYGVPAMPHVVVGLHYGHILGEEQALRMIARYPLVALVLVVLAPLAGTPMEGVRPPGVVGIGRLFALARELLPQPPIMLGCARPAGERKRAIERLAIKAGFDGIAYPSDEAVRYARRRGYRPRFHEQCCAIMPVEEEG